MKLYFWNPNSISYLRTINGIPSTTKKVKSISMILILSFIYILNVNSKTIFLNENNSKILKDKLNLSLKDRNNEKKQLTDLLKNSQNLPHKRKKSIQINSFINEISEDDHEKYDNGSLIASILGEVNSDHPSKIHNNDKKINEGKIIVNSPQIKLENKEKHDKGLNDKRIVNDDNNYDKSIINNQKEMEVNDDQELHKKNKVFEDKVIKNEKNKKNVLKTLKHRSELNQENINSNKIKENLQNENIKEGDQSKNSLLSESSKVNKDQPKVENSNDTQKNFKI